MNRFLLIITVCFFSCQLVAQVKMLSFEDFRNSQLSETEITKAQQEALYPIYFKSPFIDEAEIRTQTNEFELDQMEYTLRLSANSKNIRKYQNRIYQDLRNEYLFELRQTQEDELEDLYKFYLEYYFNTQKLNLRKQILPIYEDIITMLSKKDIDGELSITDFIDASKKRDKLQIRIERDGAFLEKTGLSGKEIQSIVSIKEIDQFLALFMVVTSNESMEEHRFELNKIENSYQLEKAERDKTWDFAQVKFSGNPNDIWQEKVSIGFGFRFPHSSKNSLDMVELQLERLIEEEKFEQQKKELQDDMNLSVEKYREQYDNYFATEKIVNNLKKYDALTKSIKPQSKSDVVDILQLNIDSIDEELNLISAKEELYDSYLELAKSMGLFEDSMNSLHLNLLSPNLVELAK